MPAPTDPGDFTAGLPAVASAVNTRFQRLYAAIAAGAIDATMLTPAAQPNNGVWRTIFTCAQVFTGSAGGIIASANTGYHFTDTGNTIVGTGVSLLQPAEHLYLAAADYAVTGLTTKIRLRVTHASNASTLNGTLVALLAPVTVAGGVGVISLSPGSSTASASIAAPSASGVATAVSAETTFPSDGGYLPYWQVTGSIGSNHCGVTQLQVQVRNV